VSDDAALGEVIAGDYRLREVLAVGGSGTVYRAEQLSHGRGVALKLMHAEHPEGDAERQRFSREASVLQELEHPHVVRVVGHGHTGDGIPFLVFPLLEGRTLEERLESEGALDWSETGRLILQVLAALDRAHGLDIVHRDIKPANIFLCPSVIGENVQLLDFGLARAVRGTDMEVTRAGAVVGTPRYMAPEQVRGERVGPTADIYGVGLVLAEMISGSPICTAERELDIYMVHGSDKELPLPIEVLRSPFAAIVRRAVAKPLAVRYRLANQMLADVRAVVDQLGSGTGALPSADMDATYVVDPRGARPLSLPTELSEKLRDAFNAMSQKADADEAPPTLRRAVPAAAETLRMAVEEVPEAAMSMPFLLTRAAHEDGETIRMERPPELEQAASSIGEAPPTLPYRRVEPTPAQAAAAPALAAAPAPAVHVPPAHAHAPPELAPLPMAPPYAPPPPYPPPLAYPPPPAFAELPHASARASGRAKVALVLSALALLALSILYLALSP
jgi:serine/threonine-protein kinase